MFPNGAALRAVKLKPSGAPTQDNAINNRKKHHVMRHLRTEIGTDRRTERKCFHGAERVFDRTKEHLCSLAAGGINCCSEPQSVLFVSVYNIGRVSIDAV